MPPQSELAAAMQSSSSTACVPSDHRLTSCPGPLRMGGSQLLLAMALSPEYESRRPPEVEGKLLHQQAGQQSMLSTGILILLTL